MWKLTLDPNFVNTYQAEMLPGLVQRVKSWGEKKDEDGNTTNFPYKEIRARLLRDYAADDPKNTDVLKHLLTAPPQAAYDLNNQLMAEFVKDAAGNSIYKESDLSLSKKPAEYGCLKIIETVFDYEGVFNSDSKKRGYWLAKAIGHNTCTYCNRQYTFTVDGKNKYERLTRPAFDHWFPKSLFPLLSLNIFNLIPSCNICNSSAKGNRIFHLGQYVHPYTQQDDDPKFKFFPAVSDNPADTWHVVLDRDPVANPDVDNTIKAFGLDKIYDMHGPIEVKDMMDFAQAYNGTYLHMIYNRLLSDLQPAGFTQADIYRMLFGTESIPSQFLDRPLSKLKHDILEYLHIIP